jgi:hypothetical protein
MKAATLPTVLLLALLGGLPASAQPATPSRITGVPGLDPRVSLSVNGTAGEVVGNLAQKAGWSLTASGDHLSRQVSLRIKNRPATEVLSTVIEVADLQARFGPGDALVVQDAAPVAPPATAVVPVAPATDQVPTASADKDEDEDEADEEEEKASRRHKRKKGNDRTAVGEDIVIEAGETVGDVVSTGGSVTVRGHATGDVVAVGGSVVLESGSRVDGDAVAVGGTVEVKSGAKLGGERSSVGGPLGKVLSGAIKMSPTTVSADKHEKHEKGFFGRLWWTVPFFVLGFLTMLFVPDRLLSLREAVAARPWAATAAGAGSWFGIVALCILLAVTIIGIPLIPLALVGYFALGLFGLTALAWWIGSKLTFVPGIERPLLAFTLGTLVLALVAAIPYVGKVALWMATTVSGGAALLMLIAHLRSRRNPPAPPVLPEEAI